VKPPPAPAYSGAVDIRIWRTVSGEAVKLTLRDDGALPVRDGDQFRIEAEVQPAAFLYLFWIDTEGQALPVYPWQAGKWATRPTTERPRSKLSLPEERATGGYTIRGKTEGMETLLLLGRSEPWALDEAAVQRLFAGLPPQRPVQDRRAAVWFESGEVVQHDARRLRSHFAVTEINDPVLRLQGLLRERLQPQAAFTAAVSFARQGRP
jgi:hypothetical protein